MPSSSLETFFEVVVKCSNGEEADVVRHELETYGGYKAEVREVAK